MARDGRVRSGRKPLGDVSNAAKIMSLRPKISQDTSAAVNRLSRAQSDLSHLLPEIEKLITRSACSNCKMEIQEIESLTVLFSEMHSYLKPMVRKCEQVFGRSFAAADHLLNKISLDKDPSCEAHEKITAHNTSETAAMDPLVISPSPLVSWKGNCSLECGKQLFLLTPLPKSKFVSEKKLGSCKPQKTSSVIAYDAQLPCRTDWLPPAAATIECPNRSTAEVAKAHSHFCKEKCITKLKTEQHFLSVPPNKEAKHNSPLKAPFKGMSPFRTCKLLEPGTGILEEEEEEDCVSPVPSTFYFNVPHCEGDSPPKDATVTRSVRETSLDWFFSPPKTCVVLDPTDNVSADTKSSPELAARQQAYADGQLATNIATVDATPSWRVFRTPMLQCPESSCVGKKNAGETTLKRELWTRFDAVSSKGLCCSISVLPKTKGSRFLDKLDEVSLDETNLC